MFHPVGFEPPSVYWRRRLFLIGGIIAILVLAALTIKAATGGGGTDLAGGSPVSSGPASKHASSPSTHSHGSGHTTGTRTSPLGSSSAGAPPTGVPGTGGAGTDGAPAPCVLSDLQVAAKVGSATYAVGASPIVELQVTNAGTAPCVQDLADKQIELRVYNGSSRVWGSHDCAIQPGVKKRTLAVGQPYVSSIQWGGLSSQKGCVGQRERVGAGKYTLYALLAGKKGTTATFTIS